MNAAKRHPLIKTYGRLANKPLGKWLFSRAVCLRAPYFSSIRPTVETLEQGRVVVRLPKRRAVHNHIGTVHAIAMCNACELAGGLATEISIPGDMRWIPKGMTVQYLAKAETDLRATARIQAPPASGQALELVVPVTVTDTDNSEVMHADITMWVTPKRQA